jgi:hypothetical protein
MAFMDFDLRIVLRALGPAVEPCKSHAGDAREGSTVLESECRMALPRSCKLKARFIVLAPVSVQASPLPY